MRGGEIPLQNTYIYLYVCVLSEVLGAYDT